MKKVVNLDMVRVCGLNLLGNNRQRHLTVTQVANLAGMYRDATGAPAFQYPHYTFEVYSDNGGGWKLSRYPNKAGIITRISHTEVQENAKKRDTEHQINEMCRTINAKFLAAVEAGRDPMTDPDYTAAIDAYRQFCVDTGLNK